MTLKPTPSSPKSTLPPTHRSLKFTTTEPAAGPNTLAKAPPPALPSPIPESTESSPTPLQSQTILKRLLLKKKSDSSNDGFNATVLILEETLGPQPITHKAQYREHDELLHLCSADFSPRDTRSATLLHAQETTITRESESYLLKTGTKSSRTI